MTISSPGLGSGLDVTSIVSQLMDIERQPLDRLKQKESQVQAEISAYGSFKSVLSSFQTAIEKLNDPATFQATIANSTDTGILTVTSNTDAISSSYSITVNRLAQMHKLGSAEFAETATFGGNAGDELNITVAGNSFTLDLSTAMTLSDIQKAINVSGNEAGVTAGLITGDNGNQTLVFTSSSSGYDNRVQVSYSGTVDANTFNFSMLNRDTTNQPLSSESELDASLMVDGVALTRGSNSITDVVDGLTFNLAGLGGADVSVGLNTTTARQAVEGFVSAYNKVKDQLTSLISNGANSSLVRGFESQLRGVLNSVGSAVGGISYISELGVTTNIDTGKLEIDSTQLTSALEDTPDGVVSFFTEGVSGFATRMDNMLENMLKAGGTIESVVQGANDRVDALQRSQDSMDRRLESIEQRYLQQFGALDTLMASMTTTSSYLTSQLDMLSNMVSGNNK